MPYADAGWLNVDPVLAIERLALFEALNNEPTQRLVNETSKLSVQDLLKLMSCKDGQFWDKLLNEVDAGTEFHITAIVYTLLTRIPHRTTVYRKQCSEILHTALRMRAGLMVLRIIIQTCPLSLVYASDLNGQTIAHLAITYGCELDLIRVMVHTDPKVAQLTDANGLSLLHYAVLYKMPFAMVQYLYNANPESIVYRTYNKKEVAYLPAKYDSRSPDYRVFLAPGLGTPLCIALHQNRTLLTTTQNQPVIEFLEQYSNKVNLVPDSSGDIPLLKLIKGKYTEHTMLSLLETFLQCHSECGGTAALYTDADGHIPLQVAVQRGLSHTCLLTICSFSVTRIPLLMNMVRTNTCDAAANNSALVNGIVLSNAPHSTQFDADGCMLNVVGFFATLPAMCMDQLSDWTAPTTYYTKKQTVMTFEEAHKCAKDISQWIVPRNSLVHFQGSIVARMLRLLQVDFLRLPRLMQPLQEYQRSLQQEECVQIFALACADDNHQHATEPTQHHQRELMAWVEDEKNTAAMRGNRAGKAQRKQMRRIAYQASDPILPVSLLNLVDPQPHNAENPRQKHTSLHWIARQETIKQLYQQHLAASAVSALEPDPTHPFIFGKNMKPFPHTQNVALSHTIVHEPHQLRPPPSPTGLDAPDATPAKHEKTPVAANAWMNDSFIARFDAAVHVSQQSTNPSLILDALTNSAGPENDNDVCVLCLVNPRNIVLLPCQCPAYCNECVDTTSASKHIQHYQCPLCRHIVLTSEPVKVPQL